MAEGQLTSSAATSCGRFLRPAEMTACASARLHPSGRRLEGDLGAPGFASLATLGFLSSLGCEYGLMSCGDDLRMGGMSTELSV